MTKRLIIFFIFIVLIVVMNFTLCRYLKIVNFKSSSISFNVSESKNRNVYLCSYSVAKEYFGRDSLFLNYKEIWLEKGWINYLDKDSREKVKIDSCHLQLVINFTNGDLFKNNIYGSKFVIRDTCGISMGFEGGSDWGILFLDNQEFKSMPSSIRLNIIKVNSGIESNLDTLKIGYLILEKKSEE